MGKIGLIIGREYLTRVRKKTFIVMTILGPLLYAGILVGIGLISQVEDKGIKEIAVVEYDLTGQPVPDSLQFFRNVIPDKDNIKFTYLNNARLPDVLKAFGQTHYDGVLFLSDNLISGGRDVTVEFFYKKPPSLSMENHISNSLEKYLFDNKLIARNIPASVIQSLETNVKLNRINWKNWPDETQDSTDVERAIGYISGFLIYMFIFMFGAQVMQGVFEEKSNRIIEVIISSVKPFQLMMGKVIGVGLIGLTQFAIWIILTFSITSIAQQIISSTYKPGVVQTVTPADMMTGNGGDMTDLTQTTVAAGGATMVFNNIMQQFKQVNFALVIGAFIFYFIGGYLLYGSLFASIGAAVDSQTDTGQFMFPITIPMLLGLIVAMNSFTNPSGNLAVVFSIIPLTSPIVMMARIAFGVPFLQLAASAALLIITFVGSIWMAGKIYRTGILMYGKKASYKEIWKWLRYNG